LILVNGEKNTDGNGFNVQLETIGQPQLISNAGIRKIMKESMEIEGV
jgi:hypothetical protein